MSSVKSFLDRLGGMAKTFYSEVLLDIVSDALWGIPFCVAGICLIGLMSKAVGVWPPGYMAELVRLWNHATLLDRYAVAQSLGICYFVLGFFVALSLSTGKINRFRRWVVVSAIIVPAVVVLGLDLRPEWWAMGFLGLGSFGAIWEFKRCARPVKAVAG